MNKILQLMPSLETEELSYLQILCKDMTDEQLQQFAAIYNAKRKGPQIVLLLALLGFFGVAGVQRFIIDQMGMGLLYLFTGGLCFIGTIIDIINYKKLAFEFNEKIARQVNALVRNT